MTTLCYVCIQCSYSNFRVGRTPPPSPAPGPGALQQDNNMSYSRLRINFPGNSTKSLAKDTQIPGSVCYGIETRDTLNKSNSNVNAALQDIKDAIQKTKLNNFQRKSSIQSGIGLLSSIEDHDPRSDPQNIQRANSSEECLASSNLSPVWVPRYLVSFVVIGQSVQKPYFCPMD